MAETTTDLREALVHVAGPVETEKVGSKRAKRQRCLRCDCLMRDERERAQWWTLGDRVACRFDGTVYLIERSGLRTYESPCNAVL